MVGSTVKFWYKILDEAPPQPLPKTLPLSPLDAKDGFIHLSNASEVPLTAGRYFGSNEKLWVLKLRREKLEGRVEFTDEYGERCPHIHDSPVGLGRDNVEEVIELRRSGEQEWKDVPGMKALHD